MYVELYINNSYSLMHVQLRQLISQQEVQIQQKLQKEVCTCIIFVLVDATCICIMALLQLK